MFRKDIPYAVALEGGGAKGGYEVGVWKALREEGIQYNAVSGTSVGALNGALMVAGKFDEAVDLWSSIKMSSLVAVEEKEGNELSKLFSGEFQLGELPDFVPKILSLIKGGGLDITPLKNLLRATINASDLRESEIPLFVTTLALTDRKPLEVRVNSLQTDDQVYDMLLASAYHPAFKNEPLSDGKQYLDGGVFDSFPLHALIENGYKNIIGVRLPGRGVERPLRIPKDVSLTVVRPTVDVGNSLAFDAEKAKYLIKLGYFDAKKAFYGLYGKKYYVKRTLSDRNALDWLLDRYERNDVSEKPLRTLIEEEIPGIAKRLGERTGSYYEIMIAMLEEEAEARGVEPFLIRTDLELMRAIADIEIERRKNEKATEPAVQTGKIVFV